MLRNSLLHKAIATAVVMAALAAAPSARAGVKLYLKDGTYQLVSSYEVQGDRVRYYSVERSEWEEIPSSLVDFDATRRVEQEEKDTAKKKLEEAKEIGQQRFNKAPDQGMEVAPGIRLPGDDGLFTVEGPRLVRMVQSSAEVVTDRKRAALVLAVPLPVMKARSLVILDGTKAAIRLSSPQPVFYVQSTDALGKRLVLVRLKAGKESRVVEQVEGARAGIGKGSEVRVTLPLEHTEAAANLYKLKPSQPLDSGEYALGEVVAEQKLALDLFDFGIDKWETVK